MHEDYSFVPHLCVDVIGEPVDDGAIIVLPDKGKVKVLNEVGTRIWQLINSQRSVTEIADIICQEFDVNRDKALIETDNFIKNLQKAGIVAGETSAD